MNCMILLQLYLGLTSLYVWPLLLAALMSLAGPMTRTKDRCAAIIFVGALTTISCASIFHARHLGWKMDACIYRNGMLLGACLALEMYVVVSRGAPSLLPYGRI